MSSARPSRFTLTAPGDVRLYSTAELMELPPMEWLVDGFLPAGGLSVIYGEPGVAKTFLAIDLAMSIACQEPWQARDINVDDPFVVYVSAEGGTGIRQRVKAWLSMHMRDVHDPQIAWLLEAIELYDGAPGIDTLINRLTEEVDRVPTHVYIDTLARCYRGDENQQVDMNAFIRGCDQIREYWGCGLTAIHHSGRKGPRERGNSALRGAADTMIYVERLKRSDDVDRPKPKVGLPRPAQIVRVSCTKQKDAEEFKAMTLRLVPVPETSSCAIGAHMRASVATKLHPRITQVFHTAPDSVRRRAHDLLMALHVAGTLTWEDWHHTSGLPKTTMLRYVGKLEAAGVIQRVDEDTWTATETDHDETTENTEDT